MQNKMCECGCGDGKPICKFPGPKGSFYVLSYYDSCKECDSPIGVIISKYNNKEELEEWGLEDLETGSFDNYLREIALPIIHPSKIVDCFINYADGASAVLDYGDGEPIRFGEVLDSERREVFDLIRDVSNIEVSDYLNIKDKK